MWMLTVICTISVTTAAPRGWVLDGDRGFPALLEAQIFAEQWRLQKSHKCSIRLSVIPFYNSMSNQTEKIYGALESLCDALDLGRSESSTERLFLILMEAFNKTNAREMEKIRQESHGDGLMMDMSGLMADKILSVFEASLPGRQKRFWKFGK